MEGNWTACVQGKRILIVGHGSIGRAVAERLTGFGVDIVGVARRPRPGWILSFWFPCSI